MKKTLYFFISIIIISCGGDADNNNPYVTDDFSRGQILTNTYDNIIIPAYSEFDNNLDDLANKTAIFTNDASQQNLINLRSSWVNAYLSWQSVEMFNMMKAQEIIYDRSTNAYPCIESKVNDNIDDSLFEITSFSASMVGATGFPAIGFLIYSNDSTNVLSLYNGTNSDKQKAYLNALVNSLVTNTNLVIQDLSSSRSSFINSTGNTQTSSLNILANDFVFFLEKKIRTAKVGNPIDFFGTMQSRPDLVESYYRSDICKALLIEAYHSVKNVYQGVSHEGSLDGIGFEDYLVSLDNSENLILAINNQFDEIENNIAVLDSDFKEELNLNGISRLEDLFLSMQTLVTYFKSDMMNDRFGMSPDYEDNDGDGG